MAVAGGVMMRDPLLMIAAGALARLIAVAMGAAVGADDEIGKIRRHGMGDRPPAERQAGGQAHENEDEPMHARLIAGQM